MHRLKPYFEGLTDYQRQEVENRSPQLIQLVFKVKNTRSLHLRAIDINELYSAGGNNI